MLNWLFGRNPSEEMSSQVEVKEMPAQPKLAQHDSSVLDLAFAMDCTGSMGAYIHQAQQNIRKIVEEIVSKEKSDIQIALVEYRDHPPQDETFVTRVLDFTPSVSKMKKRLDECHASGGGDGPESVADALHQVLKLNWREESTKICVFISDAPPHGLIGSGDGFPNGCPLGIDPMEVVREMAEKNITIYLVGCEPSITPYKDFFQAIAHITGGQYVPLTNAAQLSKVIIGGALEELSLHNLMNEVNQQVLEEARQSEAAGAVMDEEELTMKIHTKFQGRGIHTQQLQQQMAALAEATPVAQCYANMGSMADLNKAWQQRTPDTAAHSLGGMWRAPPLAPPAFSSHSAASAESDVYMDLLPQQQSSMSMSAVNALPLPARSSSVANEYHIVQRDDLDYMQSKRMVNKALYKNKLKK